MKFDDLDEIYITNPGANDISEDHHQALPEDITIPANNGSCFAETLHYDRYERFPVVEFNLQDLFELISDMSPDNSGHYNQDDTGELIEDSGQIAPSSPAWSLVFGATLQFSESGMLPTGRSEGEGRQQSSSAPGGREFEEEMPNIIPSPPRYDDVVQIDNTTILSSLAQPPEPTLHYEVMQVDNTTGGSPGRQKVVDSAERLKAPKRRAVRNNVSSAKRLRDP